jgi:DNA-binding SARP family transcriptional activator
LEIRGDDGPPAGRRALAGGDAAEAADLLTEALSLWRGPPLADFGYEQFAQAEIARLEELRLAALEERLEADLQLGRHGEVSASSRSSSRSTRSGSACAPA